MEPLTLNLSRRSFVVGMIMALTMDPALSAEALRMSVADAHKAAGRGDVLLLDIRTRKEWHETGIGQTALPVSMHERDFLQRLDQLTGGDKSKPVALICAVGGRSNGLQRILTRMGYTQIIDVAEGMVGGVNGPGWIRSGLPVKKFTQ